MGDSPLTLLNFKVVTLRQNPLRVAPSDQIHPPLLSRRQSRGRRPDIRSVRRLDALRDGLGAVRGCGIYYLDSNVLGVGADGLYMSVWSIVCWLDHDLAECESRPVGSA